MCVAGERFCISNKFQNDAIQGPHVENYYSAKELNLSKCEFIRLRLDPCLWTLQVLFYMLLTNITKTIGGQLIMVKEIIQYIGEE